MANHTGGVELFYNGVWNAATARDDPGFRITRDEQAGIITTRARLTLDDRQRIYNPRNPASPLFGVAGRNTPIRGTIDGGTRFWGEVASWKPRRTEDFDPVTGRGDAWCEIEVAGVTRRLGQGKPPVKSALRRAVPGSNPVAYWPCEDGGDATQVASAILGHPPLAVSGVVGFATFKVLTSGGNAAVGSLPMPDIKDGGTLSATVPADATAACASAWATQIMTEIQNGSVTTPVVLLEWDTPAGSFVRWQLVVSDTGALRIDLNAYDGVTDTNVFNVTGGLDFGTLRLTLAQNGGNIDAKLYLLDSSPVVGSVAGTMAGPTRITVNPTGATLTAPCPVGHLTLWPTDSPDLPLVTADSYGEPIFGAPVSPWALEPAHDRLDRLCGEEGVAFTCPAVAVEFVTRMGPQPAAAFLDLARECATTEDGMLYEPRDAAGWAYRPRPDLYNQTPALTLDRAVPNQVGTPLHPAVDDVGIRNDITVQRKGGSSARAVLEAGPLSVLPPPTGVGRVLTQIDVSLFDDTRLDDHAGWHLRKGTVDATRYERVTVDLDANPALAAAAAAVDIGDVIEILNTEEGGALLLVLGYTETATGHRRKITYKCTPYAPWLWTTDAFTRTVANGWGTSTSGHVWSTAGGSASDYSTNGTRGLISLGSTSTSRTVFTGSDIGNVDETVNMSVTVLATGGYIGAGPIAYRNSGGTDLYFLRCEFNPGGTITLNLFRIVGSSTSLATATAGVGHSTGTTYTARLKVTGSRIQCRFWQTSQGEPSTWDIDVVDPTPLTTPGSVGVRAQLQSSNTNTLPVVPQFDNFTEVRF